MLIAYMEGSNVLPWHLLPGAELKCGVPHEVL